jgi:hypothetical protein
MIVGEAAAKLNAYDNPYLATKRYRRHCSKTSSPLTANGITADHIPAKLEGLAFARAEIDGATKHTLFIGNDNDFTANVAGKPNPNQLFVFAFDDADLGAASSGFRAQQFDDRPCDELAWPAFGHDGCDSGRH